jgi:hypothetical protein
MEGPECPAVRRTDQVERGVAVGESIAGAEEFERCSAWLRAEQALAR